MKFEDNVLVREVVNAPSLRGEFGTVKIVHAVNELGRFGKTEIIEDVALGEPRPEYKGKKRELTDLWSLIQADVQNDVSIPDVGASKLLETVRRFESAQVGIVGMYSRG